jgi:outer membrane receptor protein involved in Fe transport
VRVTDIQGRGGNPDDPPLYAQIDFVLFEGYQTPSSDWTPELAGAAGDSNKSYYNSAEHVATFENVSNQLKWSFTHTLSPKTFYEVKLSRLQFNAWNTVSSQTPADFETAGKFVWIPGRGPSRSGNRSFYTDENVPYFVTAYDRPTYSRRNTVTWLVRSDLTSQRWRGHKVKTGVLVNYNDLDNADFVFPGEQRFYGQPYGQGRNAFHNFNPEGSLYLQDRWEYEGMVVNAGVRFDFFSPGGGVNVELNNKDVPRNVERWQSQWSPRLGLAFPITDRDVFHFHYGRFIQFPDKNFLFASQDVNAAIGTIGNPNLQPETSISYQAGIKHQFSNTVSGQFALFNKDVYDLVSSIQVTDDSTGQTPFRFVNKAFASSRGIELSMAKAFSNHFAMDVSYTYSFADGVASNVDFGRQAAGLSYIPNGELPLDWDQRHTLNTTLTIARPGDWSGTVVHSYGSGFPWTPVFRFEKKQDPLLENSRRFNATNTVNFRGEKFFRVYGRTLRLFFDGRNLLNDEQVVGISPAVFPGMENAQNGYLAYATEQNKFGGAYLKDTDGDGSDEFFPVNDPRVYAQRRLFRIGLGFEF